MLQLEDAIMSNRSCSIFKVCMHACKKLQTHVPVCCIHGCFVLHGHFQEDTGPSLSKIKGTSNAQRHTSSLWHFFACASHSFHLGVKGGRGGGGLSSTPMAPQLPGAVLAPPLNNIGPSKDIIKSIYGTGRVAIFGWWLYHLWPNGTLMANCILHILYLVYQGQPASGSQAGARRSDLREADEG